MASCTIRPPAVSGCDEKIEKHPSAYTSFSAKRFRYAKPRFSSTSLSSEERSALSYPSYFSSRVSSESLPKIQIPSLQQTKPGSATSSPSTLASEEQNQAISVSPCPVKVSAPKLAELEAKLKTKEASILETQSVPLQLAQETEPNSTIQSAPSLETKISTLNTSGLDTQSATISSAPATVDPKQVRNNIGLSW